MKLTHQTVPNSVPDAPYEAALHEMRARHDAEHEAIHDGSGRSEELPSDLSRRQAEELSRLQKDRDQLGVMEWLRLYGQPAGGVTAGWWAPQQ